MFNIITDNGDAYQEKDNDNEDNISAHSQRSMISQMSNMKGSNRKSSRRKKKSHRMSSRMDLGVGSRMELGLGGQIGSRNELGLGFEGRGSGRRKNRDTLMGGLS